MTFKAYPFDDDIVGVLEECGAVACHRTGRSVRLVRLKEDAMRSATRKKIGKDAAYLEWIRKQRCIVCETLEQPAYWSEVRWSGARTIEAAHTGTRGLSQKAPDRQAVPLCRFHHTISPLSYHRYFKKFWSYWKLDRDKIIRELNERYEEERHGNNSESISQRAI